MGRIKEAYYLFHLDRLLLVLIALSALMAGAGYLKKDALPMPYDIDEALFEEPKQTPLLPHSFTINYKGNLFEVTDVASYEITGLVVSHNDISAWTDIYHDDTSLDTKDLCLLWGQNVRGMNYLQGTFKSGPWTCHYRFPPDAPLSKNHISNNHLIADSESIRKALADVRIGDQIKITGKLVNYKAPGWINWRNTSTTRTDTGGTACEVVFVETIQILQKTSRLWHALYITGLWMLSLCIFLRIIAYFVM